jgi:hypothetical protein
MKGCSGNENTDFTFDNFSENRAHLWGNVEEYGAAGEATDDDVNPRMRFACWISKASDTHSEYLNTFFPFPRQQWFRWRGLNNTL